MKVLRIKHTTRRYRCDIPGCGVLTNNLIAKRDDASRKPVHICDDCINGLYGILNPAETAAEPVVENADETEFAPNDDVHSKSEYKRLDAMGLLDESSTMAKPVRKARKAKTE